MERLSSSAFFSNEKSSLSLSKATEALNQLTAYAEGLKARIRERSYTEELRQAYSKPAAQPAPQPKGWLEKLFGSKASQTAEVPVASVKVGEPYISRKGDSEAAFNQELADIDRLLQAQELITWLRIAINEQQSAIQEVRDLDYDGYCEEQGVKIPECPEFEDYLAQLGISEPDSEEGLPQAPALTEAELISKLDIKTRANLLTQNATAAAIGSCIHPDGPFAKAREALLSAATTPSSIAPVGTAAVISEVRPTVAIDKVDDVFFGLQATHRDLEAQLNRTRAGIKEAIRQDELAKAAEQKEKIAARAAEFDTYNQARDKYTEELASPYNESIAKVEAQKEQWRAAELNRLKGLTIVVPEHLQAIFKEATTERPA